MVTQTETKEIVYNRQANLTRSHLLPVNEVVYAVFNGATTVNDDRLP
ncbi:MAG: hypothetical protein RIG63_20415 [Coleofasciculus chthonoplastes F3-SA18-01]